MTYQIFSRDFSSKKKNSFFLWAEFNATTDKDHCKKQIDMLDYFKKSLTAKGYDELNIRELETGKCFKLADVDHIIRKKLEAVIAG